MKVKRMLYQRFILTIKVRKVVHCNLYKLYALQFICCKTGLDIISDMAYSRGKDERERLFANSSGFQSNSNQFNSHTNKQTTVDMGLIHNDKLNKATASEYMISY